MGEHFATKSDIADMKTELAKTEFRLVKWLVGSVAVSSTISAAIVAVVERFIS